MSRPTLPQLPCQQNDEQRPTGMYGFIYQTSGITGWASSSSFQGSYIYGSCSTIITADLPIARRVVQKVAHLGRMALSASHPDEIRFSLRLPPSGMPLKRFSASRWSMFSASVFTLSPSAQTSIDWTVQMTLSYFLKKDLRHQFRPVRPRWYC